MDPASAALPGTDLTAYLQRYPREITFGDEDPAVVFDRYHAPGFVLHNDGIPLRREQLLAHVASGRKRAAEIRTTVHDVATDGDVVAARYVLTAVMRKGAVIETEIFMFGRLAADGRLREMTQLTRA
ncbi:nuclear transport factor 2 family protein [Actinoplanes subtropicus]|uniref:nuclear transport factor 2 family protein n=1 Tax=Actinoplanes subtropicus TaxID=543632 RepID=UPI00068C6DC0|nr:nuclear transport factor 2 family protein [Actinoplanes subtropicus]